MKIEDKIINDAGPNNELRIVKVQKEIHGEVKAYLLSDGQIVSVMKAVKMCEWGQLDSEYITAHSASGDAYIRTRANGTRSDNLSNLPEF